MKSFNLVACKPCLLSMGMILSVGSVAAGESVPTTADEWFAAGQASVKEAKRLQTPAFGWPMRRAKNVILFVGDGMGVSTVTAARILAGQLKGIDGEYHRLSFENLPYLALSVTASANQQTADSAPTATALVTGIKTNDGAISVDQSIDRREMRAEVTASKSVRTLLERAEKKGLSTGVVTTTRLTHATPAVNYAHISNRDWEADANLPAGATVKDIARQLLEFPEGDGLEVALGGGRRAFMPTTLTDPEYPSQKGQRLDGRNLTLEWTQQFNNAAYVWNQAGFDAIDTEKTQHLLGLFEPSHMRYHVDRDIDAAGEPTLAQMTAKAIAILNNNKKGFYLMVEAGRIDHAHHAGNAHRALTDTIALADAVRTAQQLTDVKDTLIIVTADHSHVFTIGGYPERGNPILGKAAAAGVKQTDALGLPYTTLSYANGPGWTGHFQRKFFQAANESAVAATYAGAALRPDLTSVDTTQADYLQEATIPLSAETHGGEDVAIYASGPRASLFRGTLEQNVIYHVMADALNLKE